MFRVVPLFSSLFFLLPNSFFVGKNSASNPGAFEIFQNFVGHGRGWKLKEVWPLTGHIAFIPKCGVNFWYFFLPFPKIMFCFVYGKETLLCSKRSKQLFKVHCGFIFIRLKTGGEVVVYFKLPSWLSKWPTIKLLGITYFIRKTKLKHVNVKTLISWSEMAEWAKVYVFQFLCYAVWPETGLAPWLVDRGKKAEDLSFSTYKRWTRKNICWGLPKPWELSG